MRMAWRRPRRDMGPPLREPQWAASARPRAGAPGAATTWHDHGDDSYDDVTRGHDEKHRQCMAGEQSSVGFRELRLALG